MKNKIRLSDQRVRIIGKGLYTQWKVRKPSAVERILNLVGRKQVSRPNQNNDTEMLVDTGDTKINLSTIMDKVTIHSITINEGDDVVRVNETLKIGDYSHKRSFAEDFYDLWQTSLKQEMLSAEN